MIMQGLFIDSALLLQYAGVVGQEAVKYMYICAKFNLAQDSRGKLKRGERCFALPSDLPRPASYSPPGSSFGTAVPALVCSVSEEK